MRGSLLLSLLLVPGTAAAQYGTSSGDRPVLQTPTGQGDITGGGFGEMGGGVYEGAGTGLDSGGALIPFNPPPYVDPGAVSNRDINKPQKKSLQDKGDVKKPEGKPQMPQLPQGGGGEGEQGGGGGGGKKGGGCSSCKQGAETASKNLGDAIEQQLSSIPDDVLRGELAPMATQAKGQIDEAVGKLSQAQADFKQANQRAKSGAEAAKKANEGGAPSNKSNKTDKLEKNNSDRKSQFTEQIKCDAKPPQAEGDIPTTPTISKPDLSAAETGKQDAETLKDSGTEKFEAAEAPLTAAGSSKSDISAKITGYYADHFPGANPNLGADSLPGVIQSAIDAAGEHWTSVRTLEGQTGDTIEALNKAIEKVNQAHEKVNETATSDGQDNEQTLKRVKQKINGGIKTRWQNGDDMKRQGEAAGDQNMVAAGQQMMDAAVQACEQQKQQAQQSDQKYETAIKDLDAPIREATEAADDAVKAAEKALEHESS